MTSHTDWSNSAYAAELTAWLHRALALGLVLALFIAVVSNIYQRASWHEVEDGVLWLNSESGIVAADVATGGPGASVGIRAGDLLLAVDGVEIDSPDALLSALHSYHEGQKLVYSVLRQGSSALVEITLAPIPEGRQALYYVLAVVAIFALFVGCAVRIRRPRDPATLHFFWLSVAFFGVLGFSFSGRLDRLDWVFFWADVVAILLLPPLFLHFALAFPDRPGAWVRSARGRTLLPLIYVPALLLGAARVLVIARASQHGASLPGLLGMLDRLEFACLAAGILGGFAVMVNALGEVRSVTARRQLRWIVWGTALGALPFVLGYVLPFIAGLTPWSQVEWLALPLAFVPLAFASAVVRYRLMDVEVIIKRTVVYTMAIGVIVSIYAVLLKVATLAVLGGSERHDSIIAMLATLVVVLLAPAVKNTIQTVLDRAYYRDRYDYRQALVGFARDLNRDLDLRRLAQRLVGRVMETLLVDRMALLLVSRGGGDERFVPIHSLGFTSPPTPLTVDSGIGARVRDGQNVLLDDPVVMRRFSADEVAHWRDQGVQSFLPCVSTEGTIAVIAVGDKESGEPLSSEDVSLLNAVAGQVATALEAGRLYEELKVKAGELDRLREFSENVIASLKDGLLVVGLDHHVVRWNPALETIYGLSREQAVGQPLVALFDQAFLERLDLATHSHAPSGVRHQTPLTTRHADGPRKLLVNAATEPLRTPGGAIAGRIVIIEDVTSRVRLEEQLQISDKMASIGLLAAGVAHEVNTPLTGIASFTQILLEQAEPDDPRTRLLEKIERQTFRAAKIVNGLLNLARPPQIEAGPADVHVVVNDVLSLLEHQLRTAKIQVRRELEASPSVVMAIEHKLQQVFLNLFINARDAMPKGGWLSIATAVRDGRLVVDVGDTGTGIPPEHLSRIYDPFFTTKPIGQGTGLGLSITYGIVQEHGGTIACDSAVGQGTRFVLALPLAASVVERARESRS